MPKIMMKDEVLQNLVEGQTFADVGGLWGVVNEKVSVALKGGAAHATMIDIQQPDDPLWTAFHDRCKALDVSGYDCISTDATQSALYDTVGSYDVVHCSGVIYHVPDPITLLLNLRNITKKYLLITSMVFPEIMSTPDGTLTIDGGKLYFIPAMSALERKIVATHCDSLGLKISHLNGPEVTEWVSPKTGRANFGPWWWVITPRLLVTLAKVCNMEVIDEGYTWNDRAYTILCRV